MNRDHVLFVLIGLLTGFISGYITHEIMTQHQPPPASRLQAAQAQAGAAGTPSGGGPFAGGGGAAATPSQGAGSGEAGPQAQQAMQQVQQLRRYVEENPRDAEAMRLLANLNYDIQNWSRAVELYERYLELHGENIDVRTDLGASYRNMGDPNRALEAFRGVLAQNPEHWQARYNEVLILAFDLEDAAGTREALASLEALQPANPDVQRLAQAVADKFPQ